MLEIKHKRLVISVAIRPFLGSEVCNLLFVWSGNVTHT